MEPAKTRGRGRGRNRAVPPPASGGSTAPPELAVGVGSSSSTPISSGVDSGVNVSPSSLLTPSDPTPTSNISPGEHRHRLDPTSAEERTMQVVTARGRELRMKIAPADQSITSVMARPAYGTVGTPYQVLVNYFRMRIAKGEGTLKVQQYQWDFTEAIGGRKMDRDERRVLFWIMVKDQKWNGARIIFDDSKTAFTLETLDFTEKEFTITHQLHSDSRPRDYIVKMLWVATHQVDVTRAAMENHRERQTTSAQIIDLVLTQARRCPLDEFKKFSDGYYPFGSSIYQMPSANNRSLAFNLGGGKEAWKGFSTAVKVCQGSRPMMNIDVAMSVFYKEQSCIAFMCEVLNDEERTRNNGRPNDQFHVSAINETTELNERFILALKKAFTGVRLRTTHLADKNTDYKFTKFGPKPADITFTQKNHAEGTEIETNIQQYFQAKYGMRLRYPGLPAVYVGPKAKPTPFPMEVMAVYSPQKCIKKLSIYQNADMIREGGKPAPERRDTINGMVKNAFAEPSPFMVNFEVQMKTEMEKAGARILGKPNIVYAGNRTAQVREGGWRSDGYQFLEAATVNSYALINFSRADQKVLEEMCVQVVGTAQQCGVRWNAPQFPDYVCTRFDNGRGDVKSPEWTERLRVQFREAKKVCVTRLMERTKESEKACNNQMILVLCILEGKDSAVYSRIKYVTEISESGVITERETSFNVMTQCMQLKTCQGIARPKQQRAVNATAANLAMKINMKMGGINNSLQAELAWRKYTGPDGDGATLFLGIDVSHPGPKDETSPSIGSVVGNVNLEATKYSPAIKIQKHRREHLVYLYDAVRERLMDFFKRTHKRPTRIIVYRDGVSEGQFVEVLREEMGGIRTGCSYLEPDYQPPITYIVVQKRHHTRFFPADGRGEGRAGNIPAGTVVDTVVTHPTEYDFFLCSHGGGLGTSRPTHYHVLHDENNIPVDELQALTYQLCHVYGRCPKSVSIPAPCYFADLCCTRARAHLVGAGEENSSGSLQDRRRPDPPRGEGDSASVTDSRTSSSDVSGPSSEEILLNKVSVQHSVKQNMYFA